MKTHIAARYKNTLTFETRSIRVIKRKNKNYNVIIVTAQDQYGFYDIELEAVESSIQELRVQLEGQGFETKIEG